MRNIVIAIVLLMMAACLEQSGASQESAFTQGLICNPCDPGDAQAYLRDLIGGQAGGLGSQLSGSMLCHHYNSSTDPWEPYTYHPAHDECSALYQDPWGQQYVVGCTSISDDCYTRACGWPTDPNQYACR